MNDTPSRARISAAAILVRNAGYPDVCKWMMARDKKQAHASTGRKRQAVVTRNGKEVRGGKTRGVNWNNPDVRYIELDQ
jgi:hypothetical protein